MGRHTAIRLGAMAGAILIALCGCGQTDPDPGTGLDSQGQQREQEKIGETEEMQQETGGSPKEMGESAKEIGGSPKEMGESAKETGESPQKSPENKETADEKPRPAQSAYPVWAEDADYQVSPANVTDSANFTLEYGYSMIAGQDGIIRDQTGKEIAPYAGSIGQLTDNTGSLQHIDIIGKNGVTITYDLGESRSLDRAVICNFYHLSTNYAVSRYQLFLGDDEASLYTEQNCIADYDNTGKWTAGTDRSGADQVFEFADAPEGSYFGIRFAQSNPTDDLVRIAKICLYNEEYSAKRSVFPGLGESRAHAEEGYLKEAGDGKRSLEPEAGARLADGVTDEAALLVENGEEGTELVLPLEQGRRYDRVVVSCRMPEDAWYELSWHGQGEVRQAGSSREDSQKLGEARFLAADGAEEQDQILLTSLKTPQEGEELHIKLCGKGGWEISEVGVYSDDRAARVVTGETVNDDFLGYGVNIIPTALMAESLQNGYKEALFDLEYRRILTVRPKLSRIWFQIDWMETEEGVYDFDSERMQALYPYLDALKEAGGLVELNFGWKVGNGVRDWFRAKGAEGDAPAPGDLEHYGKSCAALLEELIRNRGYDNIYAVSAYNEPNFDAEFSYGKTGKKQYYLDMMTQIRKALSEAGLEVKVWGPEESGSFPWYEYMAQKGQDTFDGYTFHVYGATCDGLRELAEQRQSVSGDKPVYLTEFGFMETETGWNGGNAAFALTAAQTGLSGAVFWSMTGVQLADPGNFMINDKDRHLWGPIQKGVDYVYRNYYEYGMLMRCVEPHSTVYAVESGEEDIRGAAFQAPDGHLTIALQVKEGEPGRRLRLEFDQSVNRTFHKYVYRQGQQGDANGLFALCEKDIDVIDCLEDEAGGEYALILYTTKEPGRQIAFEQVKVEIEAGSSIDLKAMVAGTCAEPATGDEELVWSVVNGSGRIDQNGRYQSEKGQRRYTTISVKAALKSDPSVYGIVLIVLT